MKILINRNKNLFQLSISKYAFKVQYEYVINNNVVQKKQMVSNVNSVVILRYGVIIVVSVVCNETYKTIILKVTRLK